MQEGHTEYHVRVSYPEQFRDLEQDGKQSSHLLLPDLLTLDITESRHGEG